VNTVLFGRRHATPPADPMKDRRNGFMDGWKFVGLVLLLTLVPAALHAEDAQPFKSITYFGYNPLTGKNDAPLNIVYQVPEPGSFGQGPYPVFIWLPGTFQFYNDPMSLTFVMEMAAHGFVSASVQYNYGFLIEPCLQYNTRAASIFEPSRANSAIARLCTLANVNCGKGVVVAGISQGAAMAILAKNYEPNVQAVYAMSISDRNRIAIGVPQSWCLDKEHTAIPADRLTIINGQNDIFFGGQSPIQRVSGLTCPTGSARCWHPEGNGAGWYLIQNKEVTDGSADHCYQMIGDCLPTIFDPLWFPPATQDWSLQPNLDWLASFGTKRIFAQVEQ
jgi:hypothetical protein